MASNAFDSNSDIKTSNYEYFGNSNNTKNLVKQIQSPDLKLCSYKYEGDNYWRFFKPNNNDSVCKYVPPYEDGYCSTPDSTWYEFDEIESTRTFLLSFVSIV